MAAQLKIQYFAKGVKFICSWQGYKNIRQKNKYGFNQNRKMQHN
jgi:hypothetical protein